MNTEYEQVLQSIYECKMCTFWKEINALGLDYRPDIPSTEADKDVSELSVMAFGINPGWSKALDERYSRSAHLYRNANARDYLKALSDFNASEHTAPGQYDAGLASVTNTINEYSKLFDAPLTSSDYGRHVFWANLAYCNSQNPHTRIFAGNKVHCAVLREEIGNCLRQRYSHRIYAVIRPKLVLFLSTTIPRIIAPSVLLRELIYGSGPGSDVAVESFHHPMTAGRFTTAHVAFHDGTMFAFLPHPSAHIQGKNRSLLTHEACKRLSRLVELQRSTSD